MDYDEIFEKDTNQDFYYNNDIRTSNIFIKGYISLEKAKQHLKKREYYALVNFNEGEKLPEGYKCFTSLDGEVYATPISDLSFDFLVDGYSLQSIYKINDDRYRLGSKGKDIYLLDLAYDQIDQYIEQKCNGRK